MPLDPEIQKLVATTKVLVTKAHELTSDMNVILDDLEDFAELRDHLQGEQSAGHQRS